MKSWWLVLLFGSYWGVMVGDIYIYTYMYTYNGIYNRPYDLIAETMHLKKGKLLSNFWQVDSTHNYTKPTSLWGSNGISPEISQTIWYVVVQKKRFTSPMRDHVHEEMMINQWHWGEYHKTHQDAWACLRVDKLDIFYSGKRWACDFH